MQTVHAYTKVEDFQWTEQWSSGRNTFGTEWSRGLRMVNFSPNIKIPFCRSPRWILRRSHQAKLATVGIIPIHERTIVCNVILLHIRLLFNEWLLPIRTHMTRFTRSVKRRDKQKVYLLSPTHFLNIYRGLAPFYKVLSLPTRMNVDAHWKTTNVDLMSGRISGSNSPSAAGENLAKGFMRV